MFSRFSMLAFFLLGTLHERGSLAHRVTGNHGHSALPIMSSDTHLIVLWDEMQTIIFACNAGVVSPIPPVPAMPLEGMKPLNH